MDHHWERVRAGRSSCVLAGGFKVYLSWKTTRGGPPPTPLTKKGRIKMESDAEVFCCDSDFSNARMGWDREREKMMKGWQKMCWYSMFGIHRTLQMMKISFLEPERRWTQNREVNVNDLVQQPLQKDSQHGKKSIKEASVLFLFINSVLLLFIDSLF